MCGKAYLGPSGRSYITAEEQRFDQSIVTTSNNTGGCERSVHEPHLCVGDEREIQADADDASKHEIATARALPTAMNPCKRFALVKSLAAVHEPAAVRVPEGGPTLNHKRCA